MDNPPPPAAAELGPRLQPEPQRQQAAPNETQLHTGVAHSLACTASDIVDAPVCQLFHELPSWNRVLWHVGVTLQELDAPGELSLVRVPHEGIGWQQQQRSSDARVLFHALLTSHRCVTRVDLSDALFEGGTLNEIRELAVRALRKNVRLRVFKVNSLPDCNIIRADILTALARMLHLEELHIGESEDPHLVVDAVRNLIAKSKTLKTLEISKLVVDNIDSKRLAVSLKNNRSVTKLCVHTSAMIARSASGAAHFSRYLSRAPWITSLTVSGSRTETSHEDLRGIIEPLLLTRNISELILIAFQLDARCTDLLAQLVTHSLCLERLDIASSYWIRPRWSEEENEQFSLSQGEQGFRAVPSSFASFVRAISLNKSLKFLALYLEGFLPYAFPPLLTALSKAGSLQKVTVRGVHEEDLWDFALGVLDAGLSGRVSNLHQYTICPDIMAALELCSSVNNVIIDSRVLNRDFFKTAMCRIPAWKCLTTIWLMLTEDTLDNDTIEAIGVYLNGTSALKELWMLGCNNADLRVGNSATNEPHSRLLEVLFLSKSVTTLHVGQFVFGEENIRFLAESVRSSDSLLEFCFLPLDKTDNHTFLRFLVPGIQGNYTLLRLHASDSTEEETTEDQFVVQDVLIRNRGLVTCATHFVVNNVRTSHCAVAIQSVYRSPGLVERVSDVTSADEREAEVMILTGVAVGMRGLPDSC